MKLEWITRKRINDLLNVGSCFEVDYPQRNIQTISDDHTIAISIKYINRDERPTNYCNGCEYDGYMGFFGRKNEDGYQTTQIHRMRLIKVLEKLPTEVITVSVKDGLPIFIESNPANE